MEKAKRVKLIDKEDLITLLNFSNFIRASIEEGNTITALEELNRFEKIILRNFKEED